MHIEYLVDLREIKEGNANRHPWEIARASAILRVIPKGPYDRILDVGAGDLYFLKRFRERFQGNAFAVDQGYKDPGKGMETSNEGGITLSNSLAKIPAASMDIGFLMDVLEHERDDVNLLAETTEKMKPGGLIIVTVPAFPCLFSPHDQFLGHVRRYNRARLRFLAVEADLTLLECFSFFTLPFHIRALQIALSKFLLFRFQNEGVGSWRFPPTHGLTRFISSLLEIDFVINRFLNRARIPTFGLSLCMLLKK